MMSTNTTVMHPDGTRICIRTTTPSTAASVTLRDACDVPKTGAKATTLSRLMAHGFVVPDGFVVTSDAVGERSCQRVLQEGVRRLDARTATIRSESQSFPQTARGSVRAENR